MGDAVADDGVPDEEIGIVVTDVGVINVSLGNTVETTLGLVTNSISELGSTKNTIPELIIKASDLALGEDIGSS